MERLGSSACLGNGRVRRISRDKRCTVIRLQAGVTIDRALADERLFPTGCALILYAAGAVGRTVRSQP